MKELLLIAIGSALVNNVVLSQFLGLCPFLGVSKKTETAAGMGAAVVFVITIASACTSLVYDFVLVKLHIEYLQTIVFILVIAALVQFVEMFLKKNMVSLYEAQKGYNFIQSVVNGIGISVGFLIAIVLLAGIREKIEHNDVPHAFQGSPIVLITASLMSIALFGFSGMI